ncbi:MAG TPA: transketolase C-terminal domain-containing protein, partial [bacterium]|nr:transketolase C-terminal domain-containing protein [bacterium]
TPVLVHLLTEKGKGYPNVESSPVRFHSVKGKAAKQPAADELPIYSEVFGDTLLRMAEQDDKIVAITPAMREGSGLVEYSEKFPDRYFDVGIAEGHAVTFAGGLAAEGLKPVCAIYSTFMQRAYDHLIHDVALQKLPVIFCLDRAGVVGGDGATHQGAFDLSYMLHLPNMVISAPRDGNELRDLMYTAKQYQGGPFSIRYPKESCVAYDPNAEPRVLEIGRWEMINQGEDVLVLAVGATVNRAQEAIEILSREGDNPGLVNMRFIKPLDVEMLDSIASRYSHLVTLEENSQVGGAGSYVLQYIQENHPGTIQVTNLALPDTYVEHGSRTEVLHRVGLSTQDITDKLRRIAQRTHHTTAEVS